MNDEEKQKQAREYFQQGNAYYYEGYYDKDYYDKAIECYNKVIDLKPNYAVAYNNRGNVYRDKGEYDEAIKDYEKAIKLKPDAVAYSNIGYAYYKKGDYDNAVKALKKTTELDPNYEWAYNNLGIAYYKKGDYDNAVKALKKTTELNPDSELAYNNLGYAYYKKDDYDNAIECYNKAIKLKPDDAVAYYNRGTAYKNKCKYKKAIEDYEKAIDIELKNDKYFSYIMNKYKVGENVPGYDIYKQIYISSNIIKQLLHVNNNEEKIFAHYTQKDTADKLLIEKRIEEGKGKSEVSPFRLNTILTSNDPTEGEVVLEYLGLEKEEPDRDYQAFIACFTFDPECLNQFRLYGKEQGQEATGVSLVFNKNFFAEEAMGVVSEDYTDKRDDKSTAKQIKENEKYSLYRCIYIDGETKQIISLGHKDDYTFFRDKKDKLNAKEDKEIWKKIDRYKENINKNLQVVRIEFDKLKELISNNKSAIEDKIVCDLLIHLRYLVKHIAFKEEQECRIVKVEKLNNHDNVKLIGNKMFIETKDIRKFIDKIYFAPNAAGMEFFQEQMVYNGFNKDIQFYQCKHPIRL